MEIHHTMRHIGSNTMRWKEKEFRISGQYQRHNGLNQVVERLNGVMRDREKVMRGLDHKESAQKTIDAFRIL
jgi:transposase-like protein